MAALEELKEASESIITICQKENHTKEDKKELLKLQKQILTEIESLMECEGCNRVTKKIATITLDGVSANLCTECGIKTLETGKLVKKRTSTRKRVPSTQKGTRNSKTKGPEEAVSKADLEPPQLEKQQSEQVKQSGADFPPPKRQQTEQVKQSETGKKVEAKQNFTELYGEVEAQTGIKKADVKKVHKLINEIAVPMDLENTVIYIAAEAERAKMKIERPAVEQAVSMLMQ